jgi:GxxExxY protein
LEGPVRYTDPLFPQQQRDVTVWYDGVVVGKYAVDLLVEDVLVVELKAIKRLDIAHRAQCLNYLQATGLRLCLLINFGVPGLEIKRVVNGL